MKKTQAYLIGASGALAVVVLVSFMYLPRVVPASPADIAALGSDVCAAKPIETAIGSVRYPIASKYSNLSGLGMVLTAADCGDARLAAMSEDFTYSTVGGLIKLKTAPTAGLVSSFSEFGFVCATASRPATSCTEWRLGSQAMKNQDLLKLKPFVGEIASEDCSSCG
jgi:hypothetical protein